MRTMPRALPKGLVDAEIPLFGICYGFQAMAHEMGGEVAKTGEREYGRTALTLRPEGAGMLLAGLPAELTVWMSHGDSVVTAPPGFVVTADTPATPVAAFEDEVRQLAGVQFHPEVLHTQHGQKVIDRFLHELAGCRRTWTTTNVIDDQVAKIQEQVGDRHVICGLSGGVDSAVAAALVQRAVGDQLTCVFVDHGLLRKGEAEQVERDFVAATGAALKVVKVADIFLDALKGVSDPEAKRKIIGAQFIRAFENAAREVVAEAGSHGEEVEFLVQGTLYPDVVESGGGTGTANIKSHHNVGGLPADLKFKLVEPFATCSKTRFVTSVPSLHFRPSSSSASLSQGRALPSGSSVTSPRSGSIYSVKPTPSPAPNSPPPGSTWRFGSAQWCSWPTSGRSASRAMVVPMATRSCCGRSPRKTP